jgi:hypothetical protein
VSAILDQQKAGCPDCCLRAGSPSLHPSFDAGWITAATDDINGGQHMS